jgi:poly(3-hydroxybutyrate) depolymerase
MKRTSKPRRLLVALACAVLVAPTASAQDASVALPKLGADPERTSVSGISSGGFMAAQLATAYSSQIRGVGVVAGGPYYCAHTYGALANLENATGTCMTPLSASVAANADISWANARKFGAAGKIDPVLNLQKQRVYAFSGANDNTVRTIVTDQVPRYYLLAGVPKESIRYVRSDEAGHAFATSEPDDQACSLTGSPYINNCGFMQAHAILAHLYPERSAAPNTGAPKGRLIRFNQKEFVQGTRSSMDDEAFVYVPDECAVGARGGCAVHVAFHGCRQGATEIGARFYRHVGYNGYADSNRLIVLYPQAHASKGIPFNPRGCWDFWGYSNDGAEPEAFATRKAPQMAAVMAMVARLRQQP